MSHRAPVVASKIIGPSQEIEFVRIVLDSIRMEARLPQDKLSRTYDLLSFFKKRHSVRLVELQSLIGTLQFPYKVVVPGRAFLQRAIYLTKGALDVFITSGLTRSSLGTSIRGKFSSPNGMGAPYFCISPVPLLQT